MKYKLPLIVLGYSPKKMFSLKLEHNGEDVIAIPVFTAASLAVIYAKHWVRQGEIIRTFILNQPHNAVNLFEVVSVVDPDTAFVAINPGTSTDDYECMPIIDFILHLKKNLLPLPDLTRKASNRHPPQTQQGED